jgi:hypothetical protein
VEITGSPADVPDNGTNDEAEVINTVVGPAAPVPTLNEWGLILLGALMMLLGTIVIRKRMA